MEDKLEITVSRLHLVMVLDHYRDYLLLKHPNRFLTASFMETLQKELEAYQILKAKRESSKVWRVPVKIIGQAATNNIDVTVADNVKLNLVDP